MADPLADPTAAALREALSDLSKNLRRLCARRLAAYLRHRADNELCDFAAEMLREEADAVEVEADG